MKLKTHLVSLLIGTAIGATALLCIAAAPIGTESAGRFQLIVTDLYLYKIDTTTGQVWRTPTSNSSKDFMAATIGRTNAPTHNTGKTNDPAPNIEKSIEK